MEHETGTTEHGGAKARGNVAAVARAATVGPTSSASRESFLQLQYEVAQTRSACADLLTASRSQRETLDAALSRAMRKWFSPKSRPTVLVVDDEPEIRELAADLLSAAGFDTTVAGNGREALDQCAAARRPFDLILTDVHMPDLDGVKLSERLRALSPQTAIVVMTGAAGAPGLRQSVSQMGLPLIQKPFTPDSLRWTVRANLERASHCQLPPALSA